MNISSWPDHDGRVYIYNPCFSQASVTGWNVPYIYGLLIASVFHLAAFAIWEAKFSKDPVLPVGIMRSRPFSAMILSAFLTFMAVGIAIWYVSEWNMYVRGYSIFLTAASYTPLAVCGAMAAILSAISVRYLAAEYIMAIGSLASLTSLMLIATMPEQQSYWNRVFPSILILALGPDFLFTAAQIIASVTVKRRQQGVAGSLIGTILSYGLSTGLGFAGTVEHYTNNEGRDPVRGYRNALYLGVAMAGAATVIAVLFVRIPKNRREGWDEGDFSMEDARGPIDHATLVKASPVG